MLCFRWLPAVCVLLLPALGWPQNRPAQGPKPAANPVAAETASVIPVKRVVLYKNGVGYFEHLGSARDNQDVTVSFTSGQLDDVLKSLTVLDLNGGRITGVGYGSTAPVNRQLQGLRLSLGEKPSLAELLGALRGARLEVKSGPTALTGRLLSVDQKTRASGDTTVETDYLSLLADNGEIRTTELTPACSVRLLDPGLASRLGSFLDIAAAEREPDIRRVTISTEGSGERSIFVSYISETPVWKSTYRIMLSSKAGQSPLLQGWAIVDNVVGQDWDKVELSLVAGAPQSFIQALSQPYYTRRPVIGLPESMNAAPQTFQATLTMGPGRLAGRVTDPSGAGVAGASVTVYRADGATAGETRTDASGAYSFQSLPEGPMRLEVTAPGFRRATISGVPMGSATGARRDVRLEIGAVAESVEVSGAMPLLDTQSSSMAVGRGGSSGGALGSGRASGGVASGRGSGGGVGSGIVNGSYSYSLSNLARSQVETAGTQELGDLFEYKLKEPITIPKGRSALVPIAQSAIGAEKVSVWNERAGLPRPLRALWIANSTGLTLDGGSFSVMEDDTFAGEGIFEPIRPGENRLASYATDLALNASSKNTTEQQRVTRVTVTHGMLTQRSEIREKKTYTFRNEDSEPRQVIVEHPVRAGYELRGDARPVETTAGWMRFRVQAEPKQTATLVVEEARSLDSSFLVTNLDAARLEVFVREKSIDQTLEEALRKVLAQKSAIAALEEQSRARDAEKSKIYDDQQRLRENMKALKGSAEEKLLLQRYTQQLNQQEDRLEALKKEAAQLDTQVEQAKDALARTIEELAFDVKL
jgi:hypothetical protein